jgi:hypothetical protein
MEFAVFLSMVATLALVGLIAMGCLALNARRERKLAAQFPIKVVQDFTSEGYTSENLLLGVPQSRWFEAILQLHDSNGQPLGSVHYGWRNKLWIRLGNQTFHVRMKREHFKESELVCDGQALASSERGRLITEPSRYDAPETGALTVLGGLKSAFRSEFAIVREGLTVGRVLDTGRISSGWRVLALQGNLPLPLRAYILALENRRMS